MEPADLNPSSRDDARLAALVRRPPLADAGFSARVLGSLPAPAARTERLRWLVEIWSAVLGVVVAFLGVLFWPGSKADVTDALASVARSVASLADPTLFLAVAIAAGCVFFALKPQAKGRPDSGRP